jgi:hypothetical protein
MSTEILFLIFNVLKFNTQKHDFFAYYFQKKERKILNTIKILTRIFQ